MRRDWDISRCRVKQPNCIQRRTKKSINTFTASFSLFRIFFVAFSGRTGVGTARGMPFLCHYLARFFLDELKNEKNRFQARRDIDNRIKLRTITAELPSAMVESPENSAISERAWAS